MFTRHKSRPAQNQSDPAGEGERLRARLSVFGEGAAENPVKAEIAALRELRNGGRLDPVEYAERVAVLLGSAETMTHAGASTRATDADDPEPLYL
jgi:hypothetical protein